MHLHLLTRTRRAWGQVPTRVDLLVQVLFFAEAEKRNPQLLLDRLTQPPYQLVFDTSNCSSSNIRQLHVRSVRASRQTNYNAKQHFPALL